MLGSLQSRSKGKERRLAKKKNNKFSARFTPVLEPLEERRLLAFTPGNLAVLRLGDGFDTLTNNATQVFVDEYQPDGTFVQSVALPSSGASALTARGAGFTEGGIGRSADGQYLVLHGYREDAGQPNPENNTAAVVPRVIGRIDQAENIDTTTALTDAWNFANPRSVTSLDGTQFWVSGDAASDGTGSLRYVANLGDSLSVDLKAASTDNLRQVQIVDGQLYVASGAFAPGKTIHKVGTGLPTSGSQTYTDTIPQQNLSQYNAFLTADLDSSIDGFDTIYAISSLSNNTALEKWTFDGVDWVMNGQVSWPASPSDSAFGITGIVQGSTVTMYVTSTSAGAGPSQLQSITDTSGYNATINGSFNFLADAPFDTVFKQITLVPSAAPVITATGGGITYTEDAAPAAVDAALTITDSDSPTLSSARVEITSNYVDGEDFLSFTPSGGIAGSYSNGILTLYGDASPAAYQTVLRSVTYENTSDDPSTATRSITFSAFDNSAVPSNETLRTADVTPVNDAPALTVPGPQVVGFGQTLFFSTINGNLISFSDPDAQSGQMELMLSVTAGTLTLSQTTGLTGSGNGTASLTYQGTLADLIAALEGLAYSAPGSPQGVTLSINIDDLGNTGTGGAMDDSDTVAITVSSVANSPPVVTTTGADLNYTENSTVSVDPGISVTDSDNLNLVGATVRVLTNYVQGEDELAFVNQNGISGTFNPVTGILTLTGSSTVANYETALASITYHNTSDDPTPATRTIQFVVSDGSDPSAAATRDIVINAVNDKPVIVAPGQQSFEKNTTRVFDAAHSNLISFSDLDDGGGIEQITLTSAGGTLTLSTLAGLTGSGNGTGSLTYQGTVAALNAALDGLTFQPTTNLTGSTSVTLTVNDLGNTGSPGAQTAMATIPILIIDPAPLVINELFWRPPAELSTSQYVELRSTSGGNFVIPNGTYLVGVEGNGTINTGEIHDIFDLSGMSTGPNGHLVILPSSNLYTSPTDLTDPNGNVEQQGPLAPGFGNLNSVFGSDVGHYGSTGFTSIESANSLTFFLVQTPQIPLVNDDIDIDDDGFTDGVKFNNWTILDSIGYGNFQDGTNYVYGEINYIDQTGSTVALTGTTINMPYSPRYFGRAGNTTGNTPDDWVAASVRGDSPVWNVSELFSSQPGYAGLPLDHIGGPNFPGIDVKPVLDLNADLGGRDALASFKEGEGPIEVTDPLATVTDPDSAMLTSLTVTITNQLDGGNEVLAVDTTGTSISAGYAGNVLTLSGSDTLANYEKVLRTLTYNNTSGSPTLTTRVLDFYASDGANTSLLSQAEIGIFSDTYSFRINELDVRPPGGESPYEYVEIIGTPGAALTNVYLVQFEGDFSFANPGDPGFGQTGTADFVVNLTGQVIGSNGLLIIKSTSGGFTPPAGTTVVTDSQLDTIAGGLENGASSFMLIRSSFNINEGFDYDSNDDGTLDLLPASAEVIDSVGWRQQSQDYDLVYGVIELTQFESSPSAATRFPTDLSHTKAAWYNGWLDTTTANPAELDYDPANTSDNFPSGGMITPGGENVPNYASSIVGRNIFYNGSKFDGFSTAINASDDAAIATDKSAYLPGSGPATFDNITSYTRGINGIMVDMAGTHGSLTADDFTFKISTQVGANNTPSTWAAAPAPTAFSVRPGAGVSGSDRVEIVWADGAIANRWLEVIVEGNDAAGGSNTNTGLAESDIFFFGNRIGDAGSGTPTLAITSATDEIAARNNAGFGSTITNLYDFDRSGLVNAVDQIAARNNGGLLTKINISDPPAAPALGELASVSTSGAVAVGLAVPAVETLESSVATVSTSSVSTAPSVAVAEPLVVEVERPVANAVLAAADAALSDIDDDLLDAILDDLQA